MTESDILVEDCTKAGHDQPRVSPAAWHTKLVSGWLRWRRRNHGQTTAPLPATAPIHELGNDANAQPVPGLLRISERSEKGIGPIFVGREDVLQDVDTFLEQKRTANSAFAILLTNAPGSGKSTILDELRFRRAHAGQPVIQLTASAFLSDQNFLDELRSTDLWQRSLPEEATLWAAARGTGVLGRLGETALRLLAVLHRVPVAPIARFRHWYEAAERLHASLAKDPPSTVDDALRAIDEACHRGWNIAVDECGHWDRLRHCADQAAKITELLYKVADATKRRGGRLKHGGLLLTGLSDAQQATMALTLSRAKIMQLAPLTMAEAAALIRATLERSGAPVAITER